MKNFTYALLTFFFTFLTIFAVAQDGEYDVRFDMHEVDCDNDKIYVNIDVRANNAGGEFNIADQNYRFSYNREAVAVGSMAIDSASLEGFIGTSLYDPHNLNGSIDTVASYNVVLAGGTGVAVSTTWLTIGRISFDIIDYTECLDLIWHDHSPAMFPPTFIGEKFGGNLFEVDEMLYLNNSTCPDPICRALPIELASFDATEGDCKVVLDWTTATEENNKHFQIERSYDGKTFEVIATVNGAGTSYESIDYSYTDNRISSSNYYRLKQVDFDGTETTFETILVTSSCYAADESFTMAEVYPNPVATGPVYIKFHTEIAVENAQILITDALGRNVSVETINIEEGPNTLDFSSDKLAAGTYFVQIKSENWRTKARRFVKMAK